MEALSSLMWSTLGTFVLVAGGGTAAVLGWRKLTAALSPRSSMQASGEITVATPPPAPEPFDEIPTPVEVPIRDPEPARPRLVATYGSFVPLPVKDET